jgi:hypothetical protein
MADSARERRIVSALLVDIADATDIGEQLGPERSKFLSDEVDRRSNMSKSQLQRDFARDETDREEVPDTVR